MERLAGFPIRRLAGPALWASAGTGLLCKRRRELVQKAVDRIGRHRTEST